MYTSLGHGTMSTCVGYMSPPGHNHDDNCVTRQYDCSCGNKVIVSKRNRCSNPDCDWVGKDECFCHEGKKVEEWPDE
jgi:hypothetical protein